MPTKAITPDDAWWLLNHYNDGNQIEFVREMLGRNPWYKQEEIIKDVFKYKAVSVKSCNAAGKGLPVDTPIATPEGWTNMGDLRMGDMIFDHTGKQTQIIAVHPNRDIACYRVTFDNGTSIVCDEHHLWNTLDWKNRHRLTEKQRKTGVSLKDWREYWDESTTVPITELAEKVMHNGQHSQIVPVARALDLPAKEYELDPYVFGAWLGDGDKCRPCITDPFNEIRPFVEAAGYNTRPLSINDTKTYRFWPNGDGKALVRRLNVMSNKHIPIEYMRGSYEQRLEVLRGLMDTDGHCDKAAGRLELCLTNERLANDACELIASLGWKVSVRESDAKLYGRFISKRYRIMFRSDVTPFRLERKTAAWKAPHAQASKSTAHFIKSIEKVESVTTRCITVDNDMGMFLAGKQLIPTHNSDLASDVALAFLTLKPGSIVITTAPTWRQVKDVLWRYIRDKYAKAPYKLSDKQCNMVGLDYANDWFAVGLSTKDAEKFFGYHADDILVIVDEASGVEEEIYIGVDAVTPNVNAHVLFIGNPTDESGRFGKSFKDPLFKKHTISAFDTPNMTANGLTDISQIIRLFTPPEGIEAIDHMNTVEKTLKMPIPALISPGTVYRRYLQWGLESPLWQALIMGQFPDQAEDALLNLSLIMKSVEVRRQIDDPNYKGEHEWNIEASDHTEYGVDVARYGSDRTIVFPRRGGYVYACQNWARQDTVTTTNKIIGLMSGDDWNSRIKIDDSTMGGGVTDQLIFHKNNTERNHYTVVPILFNNKPNSDRFYDMRAEMYWNIRELLEQHKIALPDDDELISELATVRYAITPKGQIKIEQKDEIKKRTGHSPDKADALVLSFSQASPSSRPERTPMEQREYERKRIANKPVTAGLQQRY